MSLKKIKVLIIDDSALVRQTLTSIINDDTALEVMATAADPYFAAQIIKEQIPDVITLDIEMPRMDGITFLKTLMKQYPIPVIIISSLSQKGSDLALKALEYGAVEILSKSAIRNTKEYLVETKIRITDAIKSAYQVKVVKKDYLKIAVHSAVEKQKSAFVYETTDKIVVIGASTGGTEALRKVLKKIPSNTYGIVVVQHMPAGFTKSFANSLNLICESTVKEAEDGERIMKGHVYICPGDFHLEILKSGAKYMIKLKQGELVNRHRPSVDVLFHSVAKTVGQNALGIIMTGMGKDGALGLLDMKNNGSKTVAQDEKSSIVFGMPKEAIRLGAANAVVPLEDIFHQIINFNKLK